MNKKVWVQLKTQQKPMLVSLDEINLSAIDTPDVIIHGLRENREGLISRVGFNSSNISSYNYPEIDEEEKKEEIENEEEEEEKPKKNKKLSHRRYSSNRDYPSF